LQAGDIITSLDTRQVKRAHALRWQVAARGVGRQVSLKVNRLGQPLKLKVTLEEMPAEEAPAPAVASNSPGRRPTGAQSVLEDLLSPVPRSKGLPAAPSGEEAPDDEGGSEDGAPVP
ncbi:MAG TPA: PDZ domain-containing protein, partial [Myxococcus sp.]|nr:PDZ domain-containing protein [Myxococcus sp.]